MGRKQRINPLVGFGPRAIGPYANRIRGRVYARHVAIKVGNLVTQDPADWTAHGATFTQGESIGGRSDIWKVADNGSFTQIYYDGIVFENGENYELTADVYRVGSGLLVFEYQRDPWLEDSPDASGVPLVSDAWTSFTLPFTPIFTLGNVRFSAASNLQLFYVDQTTIVVKKAN